MGTVLGCSIATVVWMIALRGSGSEAAFVLWIMAAGIGYAVRWAGSVGVAGGVSAAVGLVISYFAGRYLAFRLLMPKVVESLVKQGQLLPDSDGGTAKQFAAVHAHQLALESTFASIPWVSMVFLATGAAIAFVVARGPMLDPSEYRIDRKQALRILEREASGRRRTT